MGGGGGLCQRSEGGGVIQNHCVLAIFLIKTMLIIVSEKLRKIVFRA